MARLLNVNGTLYGTTAYGGVNRAGTVFSITRGGTEKVLHSFAFSYSYSRNNGIDPFTGLINVDGTLYGTTSHGGRHPCDAGVTSAARCSASPRAANTKCCIISAGAPHDGNFPEGALLDVNGMLYGTTSDGGESSRGTVFSISTSGQERTLYSFGASGYTDGSGPFSDLADVKRNSLWHDCKKRRWQRHRVQYHDGRLGKYRLCFSDQRKGGQSARRGPDRCKRRALRHNVDRRREERRYGLQRYDER